MSARPVVSVALSLLGTVVIVGGLAAGGAVLASEELLPDEGRVARGVVFDGVPVEDRAEATALVRDRAAALSDRVVKVTHEGRVLVQAPLAELGLTVDVEDAVARLEGVARTGGWWRRIDEARQAAAGRVTVSLPRSLAVEPLAEALAEIKDGLDRRPVAARWDFDEQKVVAHQAGVVVDVHATVDAVVRASASPDGPLEVPLVVQRPLPAARSEIVASMDRSTVVARYETIFAFAGNQAGRAQNVARAAAGIDGLVMMPGQEVSFNDLVGPRSIDNGFAHAGEIYKGEMRVGVGGGTCQVASTFHAAAYLGGLDVVERSPHSRPSGYIGIGLDATVAYPHVDLIMKNPYPFPVAIWSRVAEPGRLVVEVYGAQRPAKVDFAASTVGVKKYKRKIRTAHWLSEGEFRRKQPGRRGVTVEKTRVIFYADGTRRSETTRDEYPPTTEIYYVAPGTDAEEVLPPLPSDDANG